MFVQALIGGFVGYLIGLNISDSSAVVFACIAAGIPLLLAIGFHHYNYQAFTLLGLSNI